MTNEAFSRLMRQYERLVYTVCVQLTRDAAVSEDLTQETFLSAYTHRASCPAGYEKQWLARIAANKAKDHLQSAYVRHTLLPGDEAMPPGLVPATETTALANCEAAAIAELIHKLKEPYKSPCELYFLQERTVEETARQLGRPVKTVHTQLARAKQQLRLQLERREDSGALS